VNEHDTSQKRWVREGQLHREGLIPEIEAYLEELFRAARFKLQAKIRERPDTTEEVEGVEIEVELDGPDVDLLLERKAELLLALEHLTLRRLRLGPDFHDHIRFDSRNYRAGRVAELKLAAETAAERVRQSRTPFRFQPMNARERRILHLALRDQPGVRSESEGERNLRSVVVHPD
jgi:spoIIIJ-associated protein